jgi:deoxyadenosine/deoxycytidine kinase
MFVGCFAVLFFLVMHLHQQKKLVELQTQIDELRIIVDQKFLTSMIFDKENLMLR